MDQKQAKREKQYITELQSGERQLPSEASSLERQAYKKMMSHRQELLQAVRTQDTINKQIAQLQSQQVQIQQTIDTTIGQVAAYADLLVGAEAERQDAAPAEIVEEKVETPSNGQTGPAVEVPTETRHN